VVKIYLYTGVSHETVPELEKQMLILSNVYYILILVKPPRARNVFHVKQIKVFVMGKL